MGINRQDSRHRIKRSNLTGVVPTAHTASTDFTDGTWLNTDLREAEFFYNIPDKKLWIGTGTSSIEIAQIGSTTSGNSLEQTLAIGNNSGANNIIMGTATVIKSANGNFQIVPDVGGVALRHSINNGNDTELFWNGDYLSISSLNSGVSVYGGIDASISAGPMGESVIYLDDSSISLTTNANAESISIGGGKITETATTIKLVAGYPSMLPIPSTPGSLYLSAGTGSVYMASDVVMASNKSIKSANGRSQIDLDFGFTQDNILLSSDNGGQAESYVFLDPTTVFIKNGDGGTGRSYLQLDGNVKLSTIDIFSTDGKLSGANARNIIFFGDNATQSFTTQNSIKPSIAIASQNSTINSGVTSSVILGGSGITATQSNTVYVPDLMIQTGKGIKFDYTTLTTGMVSTTTVGTFSMATITMNNDTSVSIKGHANGYCGSPNRNMGATFYASFLKYGGTIYQNGTTDIVLKDGYGDGTTPKVWTDGTNIYISVRTFSALTSTFTTSYEILV